MNNITQEEDPFGELDFNDIEEANNFYYPADAWEIVRKIVEIGVVIASVLACITLIYLIRKFEYLNTRINMYILHYAVWSMITYIFMNLFEFIIELGISNVNFESVLCVSFKLDNYSLMFIFIFGTALAVDWLMIILKVSFLETYDRIQKYFIAGIYCACLIQFIVSVVPCFEEERVFTGQYIHIAYLVLAVLVVIINCTTFFKNYPKDFTKYKYALTVSNIIMLSWLPLLICYIVSQSFSSYENVAVLYLEIVLESLLKLFVLSLPLIVTYCLNTLNDEFNAAYKSTFSNKKNYNNEELREDDNSLLVENINERTNIV